MCCGRSRPSSRGGMPPTLGRVRLTMRWLIALGCLGLAGFWVFLLVVVEHTSMPPLPLAVPVLLLVVGLAVGPWMLLVSRRLQREPEAGRVFRRVVAVSAMLTAVGVVAAAIVDSRRGTSGDGFAVVLVMIVLPRRRRAHARRRGLLPGCSSSPARSPESGPPGSAPRSGPRSPPTCMTRFSRRSRLSTSGPTTPAPYAGSPAARPGAACLALRRAARRWRRLRRRGQSGGRGGGGPVRRHRRGGDRRHLPPRRARPGRYRGRARSTTNAAKHAEVRHMSVFAEITEEDLHALVRDRGRGFDPALRNGTDRRGITDSIERRIHAYGGSAVVRSTPGAGTEVELHMPWGARVGGRIGVRPRRRLRRLPAEVSEGGRVGEAVDAQYGRLAWRCSPTWCCSTCTCPTAAVGPSSTRSCRPTAGPFPRPVGLGCRRGRPRRHSRRRSGVRDQGDLRPRLCEAIRVCRRATSTSRRGWPFTFWTASVARGGPGAGPRPAHRREREVMRLVAVGYTYQEIGTRLSISARTVETHAAAVLRKLSFQPPRALPLGQHPPPCLTAQRGRPATGAGRGRTRARQGEVARGVRLSAGCERAFRGRAGRGLPTRPGSQARR